MPLTDIAIRSAKPQPKTVRLFDGGGLCLEVSPAGGKWWRWKYRFDGKEKRLSFGVYPDVSLKAARDRRDDARGRLARIGRERLDRRSGEARPGTAAGRRRDDTHAWLPTQLHWTGGRAWRRSLPRPRSLTGFGELRRAPQRLNRGGGFLRSLPKIPLRLPGKP